MKTIINIVLVMLLPLAAYAEISVKIKDITFIDGLKTNQVFGYGLVVGLQGTGDTKNSLLTQKSLKNLLSNLGLDTGEVISKNTAAVLITAQLPAFIRVGERIDITVSSIGDAKSLEGGILVQSSLKGADGVTYVAAQGGLSIPRAERGGKVVKTVAKLVNGGIVEKDINPTIINKNSILLVLRNFDYSVAHNIIKAIKAKFPESKPELDNGGKIKLSITKRMPLPEFIATIENMNIQANYKARVVVSESDGTIVTGGEVKISEALVSKEGLTVEIGGSDKKINVSHIKNTSTVKDLVDALNSIGASTRDIIAILKALKEAGSLHAELIVR